MNPKNPKFDPNRRRFIGACCAAVSATGYALQLAQLRMMGAVASPTNGPRCPSRAGALPPDYKALVCLFLAGGNDANNMIVYRSTPRGYNAYASAAGRGAIALPRTQLLHYAQDLGGREWALHTSLNADVIRHEQHGPEVAVRRRQDRAARQRRHARLPDDQGPVHGPLGAAAPRALLAQRPTDRMAVERRPTKASPAAGAAGSPTWSQALNKTIRVSMAITVAGQNFFQVGRTVSQYAVGTNGGARADRFGHGHLRSTACAPRP
jgi:hypothetical protein